MVAGLLSRKADAFAALLDGAEGATKDPALAHLAGLTQRLANIPQPSPAFKSALRDQLVSTAASHAAATATATAPAPAAPGHAPAAGSGISTHAASTPTIGGGAAGTGAGASGLTSTIATLGKAAPLWLKLFTGGVVLAVGGTGVGVGAHRALPGDLLYGVKRQVEAVQLDLASGAKDEATTQLGFAHARINELRELLARDHVTGKSKISSDTAGHIRGLLENWAEDAGVATTSLLQQIKALGSSTANAAASLDLRKIVSEFATNQFVQIGALLPDIPTQTLQSLTVSALGYLQRVDQVLGGNPAQLLQQLPVPLTSIPGLKDVLPQLNLPSSVLGGKNGTTGSGSTKVPVPVPSHLLPSLGGTKSGSTSGSLPSSPPSLGVPLPSVGPSGIVLPTPTLGGVIPTLPPLGGSAGGATSGGSKSGGGTSGGLGGTVGGVTGSLGGTVGGTGGGSTGGTVGGVGQAAGGAADSAGNAVGGVVGTVTGGLSSSLGPSLPLPTAIPTLPPLPKLPGLP